MPWKSKRQSRWGHGKGGKKAGFTEKKLKEYDDATDWDSLPEEASAAEEEHISAQLTWATFSKEALPDTLVDEPKNSKDAVNNSEKKDGEARDHVAGFCAIATNWDAVLDTAGIPLESSAGGMPPIDPMLLKQQIQQPEEKPEPSLNMASCGKFVAAVCLGGAEPSQGCPCQRKSFAACGLAEASTCPTDGSACNNVTALAKCPEKRLQAATIAQCGVLPATSCPTDGSTCAQASTVQSCPLVTAKSPASMTPHIAKPPQAPSQAPPQASPQARKKAALKRRAGRGVEGDEDEDSLNPMSQVSKFDWDSLKLPSA